MSEPSPPQELIVPPPSSQSQLLESIRRAIELPGSRRPWSPQGGSRMAAGSGSQGQPLLQWRKSGYVGEPPETQTLSLSPPPWKFSSKECAARSQVMLELGHAVSRALDAGFKPDELFELLVALLHEVPYLELPDNIRLTWSSRLSSGEAHAEFMVTDPQDPKQELGSIRFVSGQFCEYVPHASDPIRARAGRSSIIHETTT